MVCVCRRGCCRSERTAHVERHVSELERRLSRRRIPPVSSASGAGSGAQSPRDVSLSVVDDGDTDRDGTDR